LKCTCGHSVQQNSQLDYPCIQLLAYRIDSILPQSRYFQSRSQNIVQTAFNSNIWQTKSVFPNQRFTILSLYISAQQKLRTERETETHQLGKYCSSISPGILSHIAFTRDPGMISTHTHTHTHTHTQTSILIQPTAATKRDRKVCIIFYANTGQCSSSTICETVTKARFHRNIFYRIIASPHS
jgi:hypothetical protein